MLPVFDGHNDALTRQDHADIAGGPGSSLRRSPSRAPLREICWGNWRRVLEAWWRE